MINSINKNISIDESFEQRIEMELEERAEMITWSCDCDGHSCTSRNTGNN